jgi:alkanesulfonate monooxygenase SsuD/methylene tetrahydromethanopterin reductase-like flavin-dependent oxidoreductase (luciferase family)
LRFILTGLGNWYQSWKTIEQAVPLADQLGFWGAVLPDHYMWGDNRGGNSTVETWIGLTYLSAKTEKLKLGTLVTPIPFRPPAMLAKMVSTTDVLSSGRTVLGVGAGWSQTEFEGYSQWDDARTRVDKTEEGLGLILELWQNQKVDFHGKHYQARGAVLDPKPVQKPYPPLLFGGVGPRMLRMAGRYADICFIPPWAEMPFGKAKEIVLREARKTGRQSKLAFAAGSPRAPEKFDLKEAERGVAAAAKEGCYYYMMPFPRENFSESMNRFAKEIIPSYAGL